MAVPELVDSYLASVPALGARRLAAGEWGLQVPAENAGGEPLDVGLRMADGLLRAQAVALHGAGDLDPWMLLWWNRQTRIVRFGCSRSKDIWVHADVAAAELDESHTRPVARPGVRGRRGGARPRGGVAGGSGGRLGREQPFAERAVVRPVRAHVGRQRGVTPGLGPAAGLLE